MMDEIIRQAIEKVVKSLEIKTIITGTAKDVTNTSCTLIRDGQPDKNGVRLNAIDDSLETFVTIIPKEGSEILAGIVEGQKTECVVLRCSEVEKVIWKCGTTELEFSKDGWDIKRGGETLKKLLDDILAEILKITVPTGTGPSGTPVNAAAFSAIQQRLPKLFK